MDSPGSIDWEQVAEVRATVGADEFPDLVHVFLDEVEQALARLDRPDSEPPAEVVHFMKGCALNLGLSGFAAICARNEQALRGGAIGNFDATHLRWAWAEARERFLAELGRRFAA